MQVPERSGFDPVRRARWWMPAWPGLSAFFAMALLLWEMTQFGWSAVTASSGEQWVTFAQDILIGLAAAVAAGVLGSLTALPAIAGEIGIRRHSYGARSLRILLLTIVVVCPLWLIGEFVSIETHDLWAPRGMDAGLVPLIVAFLIAWPAAHLAGLGYGIAAQFDRAERPILGLLGACLNCFGLLLWYLSVIVYPPTPNLSI